MVYLHLLITGLYTALCYAVQKKGGFNGNEWWHAEGRGSRGFVAWSAFRNLLCLWRFLHRCIHLGLKASSLSLQQMMQFKYWSGRKDCWRGNGVTRNKVAISTAPKVDHHWLRVWLRVCSLSIVPYITLPKPMVREARYKCMKCSIDFK